ncbi:MAG: aldehyde dehydrogenase, partial [Blastocatellia bacterium]
MAKSDREIISINPATGQEIARVQQSTTDEIASAVAAARRCFSSQWSRTSFSNRRQLLLRARGIILEEMDSIAKLISAESGKPFGEAIAMEIVPVLDLMRWVASDAEKILRPRKIRIGLYALLGRSSRIEYKPLGVIGIIPAWNYPFSIPLGEAAMALMAGNTVVIKPSELTPLVGMKISEIFSRAGFPADAVKIVSGGGGVGSGLVNAAPDKILFTGSVATGKKILAAAAEKMIPVVLELGGKDPMIVFEDANLQQAAAAAVWGAFCNAGQSCSSVERLYVHESIAEELTKKIVEKTRLLKQGDPLLEEVSIGAISSERQVSVVERHVDDFREAGAVIRTGGRRNPNFANAETNLFYEPTVITGATNEMRPMQEETFGPTLPIATFRDEAEAIRLANDSEFGLTASVWTRDRSRGRR